VVWAAAAYLCICGFSAIMLPQSWLAIAGLTGELTTETALAFAVAGTFMLALGCGGILAALNPQGQLGLIMTMTIANAIDFMVTLRAVITGQLPTLRGILFLAIALAWTILLILVIFTRGVKLKNT
jgi:hypothetical protein